MSSTNIDENIGEEVKVLLEEDSIRVQFNGILQFRDGFYYINEAGLDWICFSASDVAFIDIQYVPIPWIHLRRTA